MLAAMLAACGAKVPSRTELAEVFESTGMTRTEANCVADAVLDTLPDKNITELMERGVGAAPRDDPDRDDDPYDRFRAAITKCQKAEAES